MHHETHLMFALTPQANLYYVEHQEELMEAWHDYFGR